MTSCTHHVCSVEHSIWFPTTDRYSAIKRHLYCESCGVIQNLSDDRPKALGFWMNKLGILSDELGLTQCQIRLIAKDITSHDCFTDSFSAFGSTQKQEFIRILSKYCDTSAVDLDTLLPLTY